MVKTCNKIASVIYDQPMHQYVFETPLDAYYEKQVLWYGGTTRTEKVLVKILKLTTSFENVIFGNGAKYLAVNAVCSDGETRDVYYNMNCSAFIIYDYLKNVGLIQ